MITFLLSLLVDKLNFYFTIAILIMKYGVLDTTFIPVSQQNNSEEEKQQLVYGKLLDTL